MAPSPTSTKQTQQKPTSQEIEGNQRECITHHHACDCREARFQALHDMALNFCMVYENPKKLFWAYPHLVKPLFDYAAKHKNEKQP